ncbi:isochorismatase family protein [Siccirubricoccus sp. G192]|uniref:isochorismatase family protein n=1 Tax=Siccirubricoccus sp. G192 TaxID=2849651 RepID=UPI001C2C369B|nr:isochorismatase family cysteine hydrolase [Siccirubricoccus sp. G192]MBV1799818.1 cysteine hydrolase [Siccirubricoccus sp. G192]
MHPFTIAPAIAARVAARCGTPHPFARLDPRHTALVVIDMQNGFMREDLSHAFCAMAQHVVPAVNRLAAALREAGGAVFWVQNTFDARCETEWSIMQEMATPEARARRAAAMSEGTEGHRLWPGLDVQPGDTIVPKYRYSAFIQGASDLPERLRALGLDTVLIAGTVTNVCCESSARDAMMLNFRTVMVSDACAAVTDAEHAASLTAFHLQFGDVLTVAQCIAGFRREAGIAA